MCRLACKEPSECYENHLCDLRDPFLYRNAPVFGVGPLAGDFGKGSEWVDRKECLDTAIAVTKMIRRVV